jgi:protein involved in polysaccharide export with SLBB domain
MFTNTPLFSESHNMKEMSFVGPHATKRGARRFLSAAASERQHGPDLPGTSSVTHCCPQEPPRSHALRSTLRLCLALAALVTAQTLHAASTPPQLFTDLPGTAPALAISNPPPALASLTNASPPSATNLSAYVPDDKYKLRPGDKVSLQILEDRDLPKGLIVADSGELDAPYVGRVIAKDKTCKQLALDLKQQLEKEFYYRATVIIALDAANKLLGRVYVWGQVRNQGPIDIALNENLTAGKAILRSGGFADFANKKRVKLIRATGDKKNIELNMVEILEQGKTDQDLVLQPDDSIIVPSRLINF